MRQRLQRLAWAHPQWWVVGVCLCAWIVLLVTAPPLMTQAFCGPRTAHAAPVVGPELLDWSLMVAAMMLPLSLSQARSIALCSAWRARHRAIAWFLGAYLSVWLAAKICFNVLALGVARIAPEAHWPNTASVSYVVLVVLALWHFAPPKRRAAIRCQRRTPLPMPGWRADLRCILHGVRSGADCVTNCWPLMLAMLVLPASPGLMALATALLLAERYLMPAAAAAIQELLCANWKSLSGPRTPISRRRYQ